MVGAGVARPLYLSIVLLGWPGHKYDHTLVQTFPVSPAPLVFDQPLFFVSPKIVIHMESGKSFEVEQKTLKKHTTGFWHRLATRRAYLFMEQYNDSFSRDHYRYYFCNFDVDLERHYDTPKSVEIILKSITREYPNYLRRHNILCKI